MNNLMKTIDQEHKKAPLPAAIFLSALLSVPFLNSCGDRSRVSSPPPPVDDTVGRNVNYPTPTNRPQAKKGLSTGQKVAILAGAAALYYLYQQRKNAQGAGPNGKYYLSKNGRVYYRDSQNRPHWVTPPQGGIRVPESEAQQYRDFQGYNGRSTGRDLTDVAPQEAPTL
jgi:predicted heme/steroid binding protein